MTQDKAMPERIYARFDTHEGSWLSEAAGYLSECQYTRSDIVYTEIDRLKRCIVDLYKDHEYEGRLKALQMHADTIKAAQGGK